MTSSEKDESSRDPSQDWDDPLFTHAFLIEKKAEYVRRPKDLKKQDIENCIICRIINHDESVESREIFRNEYVIAFLNIYPYTSGHILISPLHHHLAYQDLTGHELKEFNLLLQRVLRMLEHYGGTTSFNVGWNQGQWSGGSIAHFHAHVIPRYKNDINFVDIIARSRPVLHSLETVEEDLKKYRLFLAGEKRIDELNL